MGTTKGVPIPEYNSYGKKTGHKTDENGNTVLTKLNENILIDVADAGAGSYTRAQGYSIGLGGLISAIDEIEKSELNRNKYMTYADHFQIFLLLGILCLLANILLTENRLVNGFFNFNTSKV